jgi:hypothetical protein
MIIELTEPDRLVGATTAPVHRVLRVKIGKRLALSNLIVRNEADRDSKASKV